MRSCALPWGKTVSLALLLALATGPQQVFSADIPVKQVTLYKHGIGFFEREGLVGNGDEARLDFKATDMNDVLKSLTVTDASGSRITGVRYDSNETLEQQLQKYPFKIGDQEFLSAFLDRIKGARIELRSADHAISGAIVGSRAIEVGPDSEQKLLREQVTLLLDSGEVGNYDLTATTSIRLLDSRLQEQLKQYLQTLAQSKAKDKRSIYIVSSGLAPRNMRISYISPTAIWKSSYRLTLGDKESKLEGWAIVDNTTDEDWKDVRLSVVSGRPISFISPLDTPRYGRRELAELPEDQAAGPVVYSGSMDGPPPPAAAVAPGSGSGYEPGSGGGVGGGVYRMGADVKSKTVTQAVALEQSAALQTSTVQGATGATLGELFEYHFAGPVTIKKNESAMLPFLQDTIAARKLLIYTEQDGEHPVNATEITNHTSKTLDGGPVTVFDGGAYAGEALFETLKDGDKRLIGYAVDFGTRITTAFDTGRRNIREIHVKNGAMQLLYGEHQTRTYTIRNVDPKPKTLLIQQEGIGQYSVLSPSPVERTASAYRFEIKVPANGSQLLKVEEERVYANTTEVISSTPDFLLTIVMNKELTDASRKLLQGVLDLRLHLGQTEANLELAKSRTNDLTEEQGRLRQNIDSLNRVKGQEDQVRKYSVQLSDNEGQLAKLRDQRRDFDLQKANLEAEVKQAIETLNF
ncbi:MAG: hypothetical protein JO097_05455 [Acidobacteriaceae bacterium]|nr:hypothetical protein [Acidobacteriaceae bacterium]